MAVTAVPNNAADVRSSKGQGVWFAIERDVKAVNKKSVVTSPIKRLHGFPASDQIMEPKQAKTAAPARSRQNPPRWCESAATAATEINPNAMRYCIRKKRGLTSFEDRSTRQPII